MMQYYRMVTLLCSWILCAVEDLGATFHALLISVRYAAFCAAVLFENSDYATRYVESV